MTKDAEYLICVLYKEYTDRRSEGKSKRTSSYFGSSEDVLDSFFGEWNLEDLDDTLIELHRLNYVHCLFADDTVYDFSLTPTGIEYMENRFKNKAEKVIDVIAKLKSILF